jgi:nucleoid-associated protein YgaU
MSLGHLKGLEPLTLTTFGLPQSHPYRGKLQYKDEAGNQYFESWYPPDITEDTNDLFYIVPRGLEGNLPAISFDIYGVSKWWWLIALFNQITDPFEEVVVGKVLRYPSSIKIATQVINPLFGF